MKSDPEPITCGSSDIPSPCCAALNFTSAFGAVQTGLLQLSPQSLAHWVRSSTGTGRTRCNVFRQRILYPSSPRFVLDSTRMFQDVSLAPSSSSFVFLWPSYPRRGRECANAVVPDHEKRQYSDICIVVVFFFLLLETMVPGVGFQRR